MEIRLSQVPEDHLGIGVPGLTATNGVKSRLTIARIRFALTFFAPSIRTLAGVLVGGMLTLGAEDCFAQTQHAEPPPQAPSGPEEVTFSVDVYIDEEDAEQAAWELYLQMMGDSFRQLEQLTLRPTRMVRAWSDFLKAFAQEDPFSEEDEKLREKAERWLAYWREKTKSSDAGTIPAERPTSPNDCLNLLESAKQPDASGMLRLGRVLWAGEIVEPVLIRMNSEDEEAVHSFRNCYGGQPADIPVRDAEIFNSALVAYFGQEETGVLKTYRQVQAVGFKPDGEVKLAFRGAGSMLDARRLDDAHIEVTGTDSAQIIFPKRIAVLLITTLATMKTMEPEIWDGSWGDRPEDPRILRDIIWWELTSPGHLRIHPPVGRFRDLASLAARSAGGTETEWPRALEESLKSLLDRNVISLIVAEQSDHIALAERMLKLANETDNDAELDVGSLGEKWRESTRLRLEEAAGRGRYFPFTHPFDIAAIMPERIAGKIRRNYHQYRRPSSSGTVGTGLTKDYVMLGTDSPTFQVANAVFQDQAAWMARTMTFLGCLFESDTEPDRFKILEEGIERMGIPPGRLEEMDVGRALQHLLQGFSLPVDLPARNRGFLRSLNSGDPEVLSLLRSLQGYLDTTATESGDPCKVVLIPDAVLKGEPVEPLVVPSIPETSLSTPVDSEASEAGASTANYDEAMQAKAEARIALKRAIYANALRHESTRRRIWRGNKRITMGNEIFATNGDGLAVKEFRRARDLFLKAEEKAFRVEHSKPKLRVH